jgi:hypothetical protein
LWLRPYHLSQLRWSYTFRSFQLMPGCHKVGLERHGAHTTQGVFTRIAQRLLTLTAAIWHNWATGAADKRSLIAYDH